LIDASEDLTASITRANAKLNLTASQKRVVFIHDTVKT
jgi:hypothetical protein